MTVIKLEMEFNELVKRISESELQRNKKVIRFIKDIRTAIGCLKNSSASKTSDQVDLGTAYQWLSSQAENLKANLDDR